MLWVPAGLPVLNDDGSQKLSTVRSAYNTNVYEYETFNLKNSMNSQVLLELRILILTQKI